MVRFHIMLLALLAVSYTNAAPARAQNYNAGRAALTAGDFTAALGHFRPLAQRGHARAQHDLALMYEYGRGITQSDVEAVKWYEMAARQGVAAAQYRLGVLHDNGWGAPKNDVEAVKWYARAAAQGHTLAQHDLAFMYVAGTGVPRDFVRAFMWLEIAVLGGNNLMLKHLDHVAKKMTPAEIRQARLLASEWMRAQEIE